MVITLNAQHPDSSFTSLVSSFLLQSPQLGVSVCQLSVSIPEPPDPLLLVSCELTVPSLIHWSGNSAFSGLAGVGHQ